MPDPPYLTDAERHVRPVALRDRYRFFVCFRWRGIQYTRWFDAPSLIPGYLGRFEDVQIMNQGEAKTSTEADWDAKLLKEASRT